MTRYYISKGTAEQGVIEVTKDEFYASVGTEEMRDYTAKLYAGEITADEIPEDIREKVVEVVSNRTTRFGAYSERPISDSDLGAMIKEVL